MKRCGEKAMSSRKRGASTEAQRLRGIYRNLSSSWETLQVVRDHLASPREIAAATVLEEDLQCLVEECEEYLIAGDELPSGKLSAFESRSVTVLEELEALRFLKVMSWAETRL